MKKCYRHCQQGIGRFEFGFLAFLASFYSCSDIFISSLSYVMVSFSSSLYY